MDVCGIGGMYVWEKEGWSGGGDGAGVGGDTMGMYRVVWGSVDAMMGDDAQDVVVDDFVRRAGQGERWRDVLCSHSVGPQ